ncbi:MAG: hypothetical protein ABL904_02100, partial [Hyphomicrobiaceae bacterium]
PGSPTLIACIRGVFDHHNRQIVIESGPQQQSTHTMVAQLPQPFHEVTSAELLLSEGECTGASEFPYFRLSPQEPFEPIPTTLLDPVSSCGTIAMEFNMSHTVQLVVTLPIDDDMDTYDAKILSPATSPRRLYERPVLFAGVCLFIAVKLYKTTIHSRSLRRANPILANYPSAENVASELFIGHGDDPDECQTPRRCTIDHHHALLSGFWKPRVTNTPCIPPEIIKSETNTLGTPVSPMEHHFALCSFLSSHSTHEPYSMLAIPFEPMPSRPIISLDRTCCDRLHGSDELSGNPDGSLSPMIPPPVDNGTRFSVWSAQNKNGDATLDRRWGDFDDMEYRHSSLPRPVLH